MNKGDRVKILNLNGNKKGKIAEVFQFGNTKYYRVVYQNLGDVFIHTTTEKNLLREI
jgi:hypothetical protein